MFEKTEGWNFKEESGEVFSGLKKNDRDILRAEQIHQAWWNSWTFQWKNDSGVVSSLFFFQFFVSLFFFFGGGGGKFILFFQFFLSFVGVRLENMGGREKTHIFLKYCSKWFKWRWSNHCSYKGIVPTFRDLPRASESAEIWCKATRIRDFSRWKKLALGVLEIVYITFFQGGKNRVKSPCFLL